MITIPLDSATAEVYRTAAPEDQRKMQLLFQLLVQGYTSASTADNLFALMDTIGTNAQAHGLTPEILEQLLNEHP